MTPRAESNDTPLQARERDILFAVIEEYVESAQPVASRQVAARPGVRLGPASVRACMAELTELGLLTQPHVSAGRVPTEPAFRIYVDALLERRPRTLEPPAGPSHPLAGPVADLETALRRAADYLARATGQLAFYLGPVAERMRVARIQFVRVSSERVMAVLVSPGREVHTRLFEESETDSRTLERISVRLSELVGGLTLADARSRLVAAIENERALGDALWRSVFVLGWEGLAHSEPTRLYVGDRNGLLLQPEFTDVERLRELFAAIDEKERMLRLLDQALTAELSVALGAELADPAVRECALVAASLGGSPPRAGLGVIGPVRMRYDRVIPAVRYVSERLSDYVVD